MPSAISAASSASVPDDTPIGVRHPEKRGELALEAFDLGAEDELLRIADPRDRRKHVVAHRGELRFQVEQRDLLRRDMNTE